MSHEGIPLRTGALRTMKRSARWRSRLDKNVRDTDTGWLFIIIVERGNVNIVEHMQ